MAREKDIEAYLVRRIAGLGGITAKMTVRGRRGWPDRLVALPDGRLLLVEVKRPKGGVYSPSQTLLFGQLAKLGTHVWKVRTTDDVDTIFGKETK